MRGGGFARCCRIFRANLSHFTQGSFASSFRIRLTPGEGERMEDEFRILGGGFQGFQTVWVEDGVSKRLKGTLSPRKRGGGSPKGSQKGPRCIGLASGEFRARVIWKQGTIKDQIEGFPVRKTGQGV